MAAPAPVPQGSSILQLSWTVCEQVRALSGNLPSNVLCVYMCVVWSLHCLAGASHKGKQASLGFGVCRRKAAAAQDLTGRLDANLKEALNAMSSDVEELQADIERLHHEAAVIQCGNPRVEQVSAL